MSSARFASPLRRPEHSTPRPFPQVSFGLHSRGGSFFLRGISWRRTTRAGPSVCGPLVRKAVPRRREGIRIGIKSRPAPHHSFGFRCALLCLGARTVFPSHIFAGALDQLPDPTDKAAQEVVTLKDATTSTASICTM